MPKNFLNLFLLKIRMNTNQPAVASVPVFVLVGPTAIGKTSISLELAKRFSCEIISMDSMQVYRYMDIGTAKIRPEEQQGIPHYCIDIVNPDEPYDAAQFVADATEKIEQIYNRGNIPLITGGTGLYLKALCDGLFKAPVVPADLREKLQQRLILEGSVVLHNELTLCDAVSAARIHPNDSARIIRGLEIFYATGVPWSKYLASQTPGKTQQAFTFHIFGLTCERAELYKRIDMRTEKMIAAGLEREVRNLLEMGYQKTVKPMGAIGYKHMLQYLSGEIDHSEMIETLARDTRRYAKRQYTWFNKVNDLSWIPIHSADLLFQKMATRCA